LFVDRAEAAYWVVVLICIFAIGAALFELSDSIDKRLLKVLSLGHALWLILVAATTIMLLNSIWRVNSWWSCTECKGAPPVLS
jgi:hypothetical protein